MEYKLIDKTLHISGTGGFDLAKSCACGQAFRWTRQPEGGAEAAGGETWFGVIRSRAVRVSLRDGELEIYPCAPGDERMFIEYFDLERDYSAIEHSLSLDERLKVCLPGAAGIHVFNQEPFETLISFIISANNNIGRISGIIERLCALCGDELELDGMSCRAFPSAERIAALSDDELKRIGTGYRAPYIRASARRVAEGCDLERLRGLGLAEARKELLTFPGVGPKVADCVLLFSLGHTDAFPVDVWIGRAMTELFFDSEPPTGAELARAVESMGRYSGIIQQYIFYYAREARIGKNAAREKEKRQL